MGMNCLSPNQLCAEFYEECTILPFMWDALLDFSLSSVDAELGFLLAPKQSHRRNKVEKSQQ